MEQKVYDKIEYKQDLAAQSFYAQFIEGSFSKKSLCYYKEPDYVTDSNVLPTFTVLDKEKGLYCFIVFDFTNEIFTEFNSNYWIINGKKCPNQLLEFANYAFKFQSEVNMPTNNLDNEIQIQKFACFPLINKEKINIPDSYKGIKILTEDYRTHKKDIETHQSLNTEEFNIINSIIHKTDILKKDRGYSVEQPIDNLRDAIAFNNQGINIFDDEQLDASLSITNSSEKIRGLAGTGKTVILAIKAARLHKKYPNKKILYTFSTHSLYNQVSTLIKKYYYKISGEYPTENLKIMHAWGGKSSGAGVYYNACINNGILPKTVNDARGKNKSAFDYVCSELITHRLGEEYDFILLDEAQDMPESFFKLLEKISIKPSKIIYAYDELQNINNISLPETDDLFGKNDDGSPKVVIDAENDYVLKKTYRNHKDVLLTAFGFGFGFYSETGLTQILNKQETWEALGFEVSGDLLPNHKVKVSRKSENSPNRIQEIFPSKEIITFNTFDSNEDELKFTVKEIEGLIFREFVKPEDIMVIDMSDRASARLKYIQRELYISYDIESTIPGIVDGARDFLLENNVTLTTVRKAKGNEVPIVFVIGMERIYKHKNDFQKRQLRNMAFVSLTRAKAWLYMSGSGIDSVSLSKEHSKLKKDIKNDSSLIFDYPSELELEKIEKINVLTTDINTVESAQKSAKEIQELAENGKLDFLNVLLDEGTKQLILNALSNKDDKNV